MTPKLATDLLQALGLDIHPYHRGSLDNHGREHFEMAMKAADCDLSIYDLCYRYGCDPKKLRIEDLFTVITNLALFSNFLMTWSMGLNEHAKELNALMRKLEKEKE